MGLLRFYLALCVVAAHSTSVLPWAVHTGDQAVQIFYIISGFYMAMVLSTDRYRRVRQFFASRFLRIFPVTWVVLIGVVLTSATLGFMTDHWFALAPYVSNALDRNGAPGILIAGLSNITLFGQDWVMFLSNEKGSVLHLTSNFWNDRFPLWHFLLIPQAWSVSVELCFYLLVPVINRQRTSTIAAITISATCARLVSYAYFGLAHDPWTYRFFPFELSTFCLGILAWRFFKSYLQNAMKYAPATIAGFLVTATLSLIAFYCAAKLVSHFSVTIGLAYCSLLTYPAWSVVIACLFLASKHNKYDRLLGELSFPIYLVHYFIISIIEPVMRGTEYSEHWLGPLSACASIGVSILLYRWCIEPLDRARHGLTIREPNKAIEPTASPLQHPGGA